MSCETLRERIAADPARSDEDFDRHAESCPACAAWRERLSAAEALIQEALRFDVDAAGHRPSPAKTAGSDRLMSFATKSVAAAIAAAVVVAVSFWSFVERYSNLTPEALASEVAAHWYHEPDSWVATDIAVADALLVDVLGNAASLDSAMLTNISYAESCFVAGRWIPHLVVQGDTGPYMVLLMPGRVLASPVPLELAEEGLLGRIIPAGDGSIAILGGGAAEDRNAVETQVAAAVDWSI